MSGMVEQRSVNFAPHNVRDILDVLHSGGQDANRFLLNECAVIYECRVCSNLFRSLANFAAHKRFYCTEHLCESMVAFDHEIPGDVTETVEPEEPPLKEVKVEDKSPQDEEAKEQSCISTEMDNSNKPEANIDVPCLPHPPLSEIPKSKVSEEVRSDNIPLNSENINLVPSDPLESTSNLAQDEGEEGNSSVTKDLNDKIDDIPLNTCEQTTSTVIKSEPLTIESPEPSTTSLEPKSESVSIKMESNNEGDDSSQVNSQSASDLDCPSDSKDSLSEADSTEKGAPSLNISSSNPRENKAFSKDSNQTKIIGLEELISKAEFPSHVKYKEGKLIIGANSKPLKNCTLKLSKEVMDRLITASDGKEGEGAKNLHNVSLVSDKKVDGANPLLAKLVNGKRFAIVNPQLFAKLLKENSSAVKLEAPSDGTQSSTSSKVQICPNVNTEEKNESQEHKPIRLKVSKLILEPKRPESEKKPQLQVSNSFVVKTSQCLEKPMLKVTRVTEIVSSDKNGPHHTTLKAEFKERRTSSDNDSHNNFKKVDSDEDNILSSDADDVKQEKKPLIVVISKSSKEQPAKASFKSDPEDSDYGKPKKAYFCEECNSTFYSRKSMESHRTVVHEHKRLMFPCPFCDATLGQVWSVMRHIMAIHKRPKEEYDSLKKVIKRNSYYKEIDPNDPTEFDEGYPIGSLKCSNCFMPFDRRLSLVTHERFCIRKEKKKLCKKAKSNVEENSESPFETSSIKEEPLEEEEDSMSAELKEETPSSSPSKPLTSHFNAELNVHSRPKRISNKKEYKDYVNSDTLKWNYIAKVNSAPSSTKGSKNSGNFSSHLSKKSPSKLETAMLEIVNLQTLECIRCKKTFNNSSNLKRHAASHYGLCRFGCKSCNYKTYNKSDCKIHILKAHKESDPDDLITTLSDLEPKHDLQSGDGKKTTKKVPLEELCYEEGTIPMPQERKKKRKSNQTFKSVSSENLDNSYLHDLEDMDSCYSTSS